MPGRPALRGIAERDTALVYLVRSAVPGNDAPSPNRRHMPHRLAEYDGEEFYHFWVRKWGDFSALCGDRERRPSIGPFPVELAIRIQVAELPEDMFLAASNELRHAGRACGQPGRPFLCAYRGTYRRADQWRGGMASGPRTPVGNGRKVRLKGFSRAARCIPVPVQNEIAGPHSLFAGGLHSVRSTPVMRYPSRASGSVWRPGPQPRSSKCAPGATPSGRRLLSGKAIRI